MHPNPYSEYGSGAAEMNTVQIDSFGCWPTTLMKTIQRSNLSFWRAKKSETNTKFSTFSTKTRMRLKWRRRPHAWTVIASGRHRCRWRSRPKQSAKAALFPRRRYTTHSRSSASDCCSGFSWTVCCQRSARDFGRVGLHWPQRKIKSFSEVLGIQDVYPRSQIQQLQKRGGGKICCSISFCRCKFNKIVIILFLNRGQKKLEPMDKELKCFYQKKTVTWLREI